MELSKKLTNLLFEFWTEKLQESEKDLATLHGTLKSKCTLEEHSHILNLLADSKQEYINKINARNAKKVRAMEPMEAEETT